MGLNLLAKSQKFAGAEPLILQMEKGNSSLEEEDDALVSFYLVHMTHWVINNNDDANIITK